MVAAILLGVFATIAAAWTEPFMQWLGVARKTLSTMVILDRDQRVASGLVEHDVWRSGCRLMEYLPPDSPRTAEEWRHAGAPRWALLPMAESASGEGQLRGVAETIAYGWPARCAIRYSRMWTAGFGRAVWLDEGGSVSVVLSRRELKLPVRPFLPGLGLDLAIWSALSYVLLRAGAFGLSRFRRWRRRNRGLCRACGYSRAGLAEGARCPECGA